MFENFRKSEDMVKTKRNLKVFGQAFFKRLAGSKGSALGRALRSAKSHTERKSGRGVKTVRWTVFSWETLAGGFPFAER